ncbi:ras-related protein Rab-18-like isoform X2 [Montipora capricornis]|uniref:ras-related protein Rab-18-like isoform X2 n=1 Tax=Montipora capricornis TaxID=246305 RepID=UPI0035F1A51A
MAEEDEKELPLYKVALCGKADVGKTSIFHRIRGGEFLEDTSKFPYLVEDDIKVKVKDKSVMYPTGLHRSKTLFLPCNLAVFPGSLERGNSLLSIWRMGSWRIFFKNTTNFKMAEEDEKELPLYKVALCGKADVGKTSIFHRIRGGEFLEDTSKFPYLVEDDIKVKVKDKSVMIHLVDTAGMERDAPLTRYHYHGSHAVLLVYDCDDGQSLLALKDYYECVKDNASGAAVVLVRNMIDKDPQCVDVKDADNLVYNHCSSCVRPCQFKIKAETSAKDNMGIKELFQKVADYLISTNAEPSNKRKNKGFDAEIKLQGEQPQATQESKSSRCSCK